MRDNRYTDGEYILQNPSWHDADAPWKALQIARLLREEHVNAWSLCDVGCGSGGVLAELANEMPELKLVGYDISPQAVEYARLNHPDVDIRLGDAISEVSEPFDVVMLIDVFEHIEDYLGFLRRVAVIGNRLLCHIPLDMNALGVARGRPISVVREKVGHLHYFSKDTAIATLRDAGYLVEACRYTAATMELPNRTFRMKLMKWPRKIAFSISPDFTSRTLGGYSLLVLAKPLDPESNKSDWVDCPSPASTHLQKKRIISRQRLFLPSSVWTNVAVALYSANNRTRIHALTGLGSGSGRCFRP